MKGTWAGFYRYDSEWVRKATGFEKTGFTIEIRAFEGNGFEGIVNDDAETGGMKGTGTIIGSMKGGTVHFRKFMPRGYEVHPDGNHVYTEKKHRTLYYAGTLSKDGKTVAGTRKFRRKIVLAYGILPILFRPGSGTWSMTLQS